MQKVLKTTIPGCRLSSDPENQLFLVAASPATQNSNKKALKESKNEKQHQNAKS